MTLNAPQTTHFVRRENFLTFSPPDITEEEINAVVEAMRSGWITTGPRVKQFENEFGAYIGSDYNLALNSCTGALHIALAALDIGPGDEVITTPTTFCATANVIEHVGATLVLADVEADTLCLDPARVEAAITPRTRAIMPVHFAGHPADMDPIMALARKHGLTVIEDAAHALPASYKGRRIGTIGDYTAFSFYATKNLTTAEGGMLTGAENLIARARLFGLHGMNRDAWKRYSAEGNWYYEVTVPGFKYNMTDIQAAIGLVQLKRLAEMQARRREIVARYNAAFSNFPELQPPVERRDIEHAWHLYVLRLNGSKLSIDRARFIEELKARNIGSSVHFIPIHTHPFYRDKYQFRPEQFPVSYAEYKRSLSLPLHAQLTHADIEDVIAAVGNIVRTFAVQ
jgi:dTDP-4-amino-4,6-dideoxygalactose transaminase